PAEQAERREKRRVEAGSLAVARLVPGESTARLEIRRSERAGVQHARSEQRRVRQEGDEIERGQPARLRGLPVGTGNGVPREEDVPWCAAALLACHRRGGQRCNHVACALELFGGDDRRVVARETLERCIDETLSPLAVVRTRRVDEADEPLG